MADPNIVFWSQIPGGSQLTADASKRGGGGTFAVAGFLLDDVGAHKEIKAVPFQAALSANRVYQLVLEVLPAGGAVVDPVVEITKSGATLRQTSWAPIQGTPGMRGVFVRMEQTS